ncbi:MAG TPA: hypothetical protein VKR60_05375 [Candidatus Sulfotelmatobacter sp.]|nr:hypothetical protein [Candidatus Sulfotelmatobacter sp.]
MTRFESFSATGRVPMASRSVVRSGFGLLLGAALLMAGLAAGSSPAIAQFTGPTPLTLINGWTNAPFSTSIATAEEVSGIVQFRGAIATTGTNAEPFTLPPALSPATEVYIPIDLCNANNGRLQIEPNGDVFVEAEGGTFSNAQCFTSLDGASFALSSSGFTALTLINGWTNAPFSTSNAEVAVINGAVHFKGAIATTGTNTEPFVLPKGFRPLTEVYVPVDLCNATNGRLQIEPAGDVIVEAEGGAFSDAQCFTSLDGAWFVPKPSGYKALTLINGWTNAPFSTSNAEAAGAYGIVYFKGAIATSGTNAEPFVLPAAFRPVTAVYTPIDLCGATKGRLYIQPSGVVTVQAETAFSDAQCFTSLDGASFVQ